MQLLRPSAERQDSQTKSTMNESIENDSVEIEAVDSDIVNRTRKLAADAQRVVVKAGTNSLTDEASKLDTSKVDKLVDDVVGLLEQDEQYYSYRLLRAT